MGHAHGAHTASASAAAAEAEAVSHNSGATAGQTCRTRGVIGNDDDVNAPMGPSSCGSGGDGVPQTLSSGGDASDASGMMSEFAGYTSTAGSGGGIGGGGSGGNSSNKGHLLGLLTRCVTAKADSVKD